MSRKPALLLLTGLFIYQLGYAQSDSLDVRLYHFKHEEALYTLTQRFIEYLNFPSSRTILLIKSVSLEKTWGINPNKMQGFTAQGDSLNGFITIQVFVDNTLSLKGCIQVLAHELVHVKQVIARQLRVKDKKRLYWLGQYYPNVKKIPYNDRPWEEEACLNGEHLYQMVQIANTQKAFAFQSELILPFPSEE